METKIAPASIQVINGQYCDGAGNQITNQAVLDTLPLEPQFVPEVVEVPIAIPANDELQPYVFRGANLDQLDYDLHRMDAGTLDITLPEDTYDYDNHKWETPLGKKIGEVFAEEDAECRRADAMFFGEIPL